MPTTNRTRSVACLALCTMAACGDASSPFCEGRATVELRSGPLTLNRAGDTLRITPQVTDACGTTIAQPALEWNSSTAHVATVDGGLVTAVTAGEVTIRVSAHAGADDDQVLPGEDSARVNVVSHSAGATFAELQLAELPGV
ncbi:MAG: hypothetical protein GWO22_34015, partial [Actinobacteria bacterium]|nr:hypothetical protein [Actinomycetota bacterium]NIW32219.1 hypothetical protein [Actinomycetota bacterium]